MRYHSGFLMVVAMAWVGATQAASGSVEMRLRALESRLPDADRMAAIEKSLGNQGAGVLAGDVEQIKAELRELRGQIEQLTHQIQKQQQSQQRLYGDLDKRLQVLEARVVATPTASPAMSGGDEPVGGSSDLPGAEATASGPSAAAQEQSEYLAAFELLQQGKTAEAIPAFEVFLRRYPTGSYASNARYWMGEGHYLNKNYPKAMAEFQKLVEQYPESTKLPGALLKMGYIHYENRNYAEARALLEKVKGTYPNTNVSTLAAERLERMRKEGV